MYTTKNFKSKAELKRAIAAGEKIGVYNPGLGGEPPQNGSVSCEGPWFPIPHCWYAMVKLENGYIVKVS